MARKMKIDIPLIVGSNGKWNTMGPAPDWGLMADCIMDGANDPAQSRRYLVRVTIEVPPDCEMVTTDDVIEVVK